jgi:hypothetical protein
MVAASISETSVNFYQTTRRNNPESSHLHTRSRENLKLHFIISGWQATITGFISQQLSTSSVLLPGNSLIHKTITTRRDGSQVNGITTKVIGI